MKKLLQQLLRKGKHSVNWLRTSLGKVKFGAFFRSRTFKTIIGGIAAGVGTYGLTQWISAALDSSETKMRKIVGYTGSDDDDTYFNPNLQRHIAFVRDNISIFFESKDGYNANRIRQEVILSFMYILTFQNSLESVPFSLSVADSSLSLAASGSWFQEDLKSETLFRYFTNLSENDPNHQIVEARLMKVLDLAATGAPLI
jgi:hypothetical protein